MRSLGGAARHNISIVLQMLLCSCSSVARSVLSHISKADQSCLNLPLVFEGGGAFLGGANEGAGVDLSVADGLAGATVGVGAVGVGAGAVFVGGDSFTAGAGVDLTTGGGGAGAAVLVFAAFLAARLGAMGNQTSFRRCGRVYNALGRGFSR